MIVFIAVFLITAVVLVLSGYGKAKQTGKPVSDSVAKTSFATMRTALWGVVVLVVLAMVFIIL